MKNKCKLDKKLMLDYLDKKLDPAENKAVQEHLEACPACRKIIRAQENYLALLSESKPQQAAEEQVDLTGLQTRILAGVKAEKQAKFWQKPVFWFQSTAVLAALLVAVFILPALLPQTRTADEMAREELSLAQAEIMALNDNLKAGTNKTSGNPVVWSIYKGSLADLPTMACFFSDFASDEAAASSKTTGNDEEDALSAAACRKLNAAGRSLLGLLEQAEDIRVLVKQEKPAGTIIMAAFLPKQIKGMLADLDLTGLDGTQEKIESIVSQDLVARLEQIEIGLYSRVFSEKPANSLSWLLIILESD